MPTKRLTKITQFAILIKLRQQGVLYEYRFRRC